MISESDALFSFPGQVGGQPVLMMTGFPKTMFASQRTDLFSVRIKGLKDGLVEAQYIGVQLCNDASCGEIMNANER